ncbi:MAG: FGGY family carbohydrate kinase [Actinobacteria bacterium]|nr:FGGY family carbohydrate kinase [Actinomycetota bacterium]MCL6104643.1 FGGY family carbohydrate kinase [Actinomycetota bacterium]
MSILVIDIGTSGIKAAVLGEDMKLIHTSYKEFLPSSVVPGFVEFDANALADTVLEMAKATMTQADSRQIRSVAITNQRSSTILWDKTTSVPVAPGIGWQDIRTVGTCLHLQARGIQMAPNLSATKLAFLLELAQQQGFNTEQLLFGTIDTFLAWMLSKGTLHITDPTNAAMTGLLAHDATHWDNTICEALNIPLQCLPKIVDSVGVVGEATALDGAPVIAGIAGDQQASLVGQSCMLAGMTKATFGTGAMLDLCLGEQRPAFQWRGEHGCVPIVAWRNKGETYWGLEAIMLSAGAAINWLIEDLALFSAPEDCEKLAKSAKGGEQLFFVPALFGMGTPVWDFGARGTFIGLTQGIGKNELTRAVLEGIAHRGADLLESAEKDANLTKRKFFHSAKGAPTALRVDGGMSRNNLFLQYLAEATAKPIEVSQEVEATTLGAGYLAGIATGVWTKDDIIAAWSPKATIEPSSSAKAEERRMQIRQQWYKARELACRTVPELSELKL